MSIAVLLEMAADSEPQRVALTAHGRDWRYLELQQRVAAASSWLRRRNVSRLLFMGLNSAALPIAIFAAAAAGCAFVPLNYRLAPGDLARIARRVAPAVAVVNDDKLALMPAVPGLLTVSVSELLGLQGAGAAAADAADEDEAAVLLFTSGTTGEPKAGILRHRNLLSYVFSTCEFMSVNAAEAALVSVPPYHIAGIAAILTSTYSGRRMVQLEAFDPEAWMDLAASERVSHAMLVPTMLQRILPLAAGRTAALSSLRHLAYGGGRMPEPVIREALRLLPHVDFVNAYGLTETSSTVALLDADDHRRALAAEDAAGRRRLSSVGRPIEGLELDIRDQDGHPLPAGSSGEVWVRGPQVSGEYVGGKALREDGWFATRDIGWLDEAGYLFVDGRLDDVIVRAGENTSPGEIEDVIRGHPDVAEVAVIGMPDDEWGEKIVAVVVASRPLPEASLRLWLRERLRSNKQPQQIVFRGELPYNDTGKLLRRQLRAELLAA